ncbi:MAG: TolC family protein, partial [Bacteroidales bacterium]|nr:TolC family protein [Bacteroidales bacterium]
LLNLECSADQFAVVELDTTSFLSDIPLPEVVFDYAVETHPSIKSAKYNLESSKRQLKVARSGYIPTISLTASYSNSFYHNYGSEFNQSFGQQLKINGSEYVGLSVNIPIFDRFSTRNNMRQAKVNIASQNWSLLEARQNLNKEIQQAYWNAAKARDSYFSAQKAEESTSIAYQYEVERYAAGRSTALDLQNARAKLEKSLQDELQSKYEYLIRLKILEFYNGQDF